MTGANKRALEVSHSSFLLVIIDLNTLADFSMVEGKVENCYRADLPLVIMLCIEGVCECRLSCDSLVKEVLFISKILN